MPRKRKVFAHPKAILLKFEESEFLAIETSLREEREKRPYLARTELLREWILAHIQKDEKIPSDKPVPCQHCGRLLPETKIKEHEEGCVKNPKWKGTGKSVSQEMVELVELRRWWDSKLAEVEARFTSKIEVLEQFLFRGRVWAELFPLEQERLLRFFLNPTIGAAPRQFRPAQFKNYLTRLGVTFDPTILSANQDEVALFLKQQEGRLLTKNDKDFYTALR
jgi:hypothetical protein